MSEEERAEAMRGQVRAWMEKHRATLTAEQLAILEENIAFITPELYRHPHDPEFHQRFVDLKARTAKLFFFDQLVQAFFRNGANAPSLVAAPVELTDIPLGRVVNLHVPCAFDGEARARVEYFVDGQPLRVEEISIRSQRGLPETPPVAVCRNVFAGVVGERGRIVVTPLTPGARIWATTVVSDPVA